MVEVGGKPLLHRAAETLRAAGVSDLVVVRGYQAERVHCPGVRFRENMDWAGTNILGSLFSAESEIQGDLIICYSDIVFDLSIARAASTAAGGLRPVVDRDWRSAYTGRSDHPLSEAEKVSFGAGGVISRIGKRNVPTDAADGEFIGMLKVDAQGARRLVTAYGDAKAASGGKAFQTAADFAAAYLTDLLQELVDRGESIVPIIIEGGWREIDTLQDLKNATTWLANGR
jgi:choline kinase